MTWIFALLALLGIRDVDGADRHPLQPRHGRAEALFFIAEDCPVSNYYSREIHRICDDYASKGLGCSLIYVNPKLTDAAARKHAADYTHGAYPKIVDRRHELVAATGATITPEAVVVKDDGSVAYRGRIDNFYAALGKPRRIVTEHDLRDSLDAVFAGRPVPNPTTKAVGCYIPDLSAYQ